MSASTITDKSLEINVVVPLTEFIFHFLNEKLANWRVKRGAYVLKSK